MSRSRPGADAEYQRAYYLANRDKRIAAAKAGAKKSKAKRRETIHAAKSRPCTDCGTEYPFYVMQFDHVRGEKKFDIANAVWGYVSMSALLEEIEKCEVVCSNCHAIRTYTRTHLAG